MEREKREDKEDERVKVFWRKWYGTRGEERWEEGGEKLKEDFWDEWEKAEAEWREEWE